MESLIIINHIKLIYTNMVKCLECNLEFLSKKSLANHTRGGCRTNRKYEKNCPICNNPLIYSTPKEYIKSIQKNSKCIKCCNKGRIQSEETKNKISKKLKYLYDNNEITPNMSGAHSEISRKKQSLTKTGKKLTEEHKNNIKNSINNSEI